MNRLCYCLFIVLGPGTHSRKQYKNLRIVYFSQVASQSHHEGTGLIAVGGAPVPKNIGIPAPHPNVLERYATSLITQPRVPLYIWKHTALLLQAFHKSANENVVQVTSANQRHLLLNLQVMIIYKLSGCMPSQEDCSIKMIPSPC